MSKYQEFRFLGYEFNKATALLELHYGYDEALKFSEKYHFDFAFTDYDPVVLDRAIQILFFLAGVSYYKLYLAPKITVESGQIDGTLAAFLGKIYQKGLGEFFYKNRLDPASEIVFPANSNPWHTLKKTKGEGLLIGLGGGKDSLVSVELLRDQPNTSTWSLSHRSQLEPLVTRIGLHHLWIDRTWDPQIQALNAQDALNGHIPISAILSAVGVVVAILAGKQDIVVSNESSASEPTMVYEGIEINHQYSKSLEYETDFQAILRQSFSDSLRYYSLLRPFSELRIAEMFSKQAFAKYKDVFSSCNRAFTHDQHHLFWCGECPKCAFIFLILTPFIDRFDLENLWGGKNLLLVPSLESTYRQLLGIAGDKPFDCVGEIKEARAAMRLAQKVYPELAKYTFDLPADFDFRGWSEHAIPEEIFALLKERID